MVVAGEKSAAMQWLWRGRVRWFDASWMRTHLFPGTNECCLLLAAFAQQPGAVAFALLYPRTFSARRMPTAASTGTPDAVLRLHGSEVHALAFLHTPIGLLLASGSLDGRVALWDVTFRTVLHTWLAHGGSIIGLAATRDGDLWTQGRDGRAIRWRLAVDPDRGTLAPPLQDVVLPFSMGSFCKFDLLEAQTEMVRGELSQVLVAAPSHDGALIDVWRVPPIAPGASQQQPPREEICVATTFLSPSVDGSGVTSAHSGVLPASFPVRLAQISVPTSFLASAEAEFVVRSAAAIAAAATRSGADSHTTESTSRDAEAASRAAVLSKQAGTSGMPMCIKLALLPLDALAAEEVVVADAVSSVNLGAPLIGVRGEGASGEAINVLVHSLSTSSVTSSGSAIAASIAARLRPVDSSSLPSLVFVKTDSSLHSGGNVSSQLARQLQQLRPPSSSSSISSTVRAQSIAASSTEDKIAGAAAARDVTPPRSSSRAVVAVAGFENGWVYALSTGILSIDPPSALDQAHRSGDEVGASRARGAMSGECLAALSVSNDPLLALAIVESPSDAPTSSTTASSSCNNAINHGSGAVSHNSSSTGFPPSTIGLLHCVAGGASDAIFCFSLDCRTGKGVRTHTILLAIPGISVAVALPPPQLWPSNRTGGVGRDSQKQTDGNVPPPNPSSVYTGSPGDERLAMTRQQPQQSPSCSDVVEDGGAAAWGKRIHSQQHKWVGRLGVAEEEEEEKSRIDRSPSVPIALVPSAALMTHDQPGAAALPPPHLPPFRQLVLTGGWDHAIHVIDPLTSSATDTLRWHSTSIYAIAATVVGGPVGHHNIGGAAGEGVDADDDYVVDDDPFALPPQQLITNHPASIASNGATVLTASCSTAPGSASLSGRVDEGDQCLYCVASASKDGRIALWNIRV